MDSFYTTLVHPVVFSANYTPLTTKDPPAGDDEYHTDRENPTKGLYAPEVCNYWRNCLCESGPLCP